MKWVRNILLWVALLVMHLHSMLPHEHCFHPSTTENHFFEKPSSETPKDIFEFLKRIFSFDIGENHLDNFKNNSSYKCFKLLAAVFLPEPTLTFEYLWLLTPGYIIFYEERLPFYFLINAICFRGPPFLG
ncbi:MAG: hypothetical protein ACK4EX_04855 [Thermaurantimonas sp.]|uniref:hypothetical protein n=1 Tax=Thermaurantimonas sp. TaxID=2681568 RepID=UPI003919C33E